MKSIDLNAKYPWPGSENALSEGCKCPVVENDFGEFDRDDGYWVDDSCAIHGVQPVAPTFVGQPWPVVLR